MKQVESRDWKPFSIMVGISAVLNALLWAGATWLFPQEGPADLIHSSTTLPAAGLVVLVSNTLLAFLLRRHSRRASAVLCATAVAAQVILLVSFVTLWRLNQ